MPTKEERDAKREIRRTVIAIRAGLPEPTLTATSHQLAERAMQIVASLDAHTVTAYVSGDGEPGTGPLIDRLIDAGVRVLLPVLCDDFDLDWALYEPGELVEARFGIRQPSGRRLGKEAIHEAGVVFCPGVAGTLRGERLGRGGGSYDRALGRAAPAAGRCLLLYDDEILDSVPVEPHDASVDYLCTPARLIEVSPGRLEHQRVVGR